MNAPSESSLTATRQTRTPGAGPVHVSSYIQPVRDRRHATVAVNNPTVTINKIGLDI